MKLQSLLQGVACSVVLTTNIYAQDVPKNEADQASAGQASAEQKSADDLSLDKKRANARQLATDASNDYRMGSFPEAYDKFNRAYRLVGVPALGVWSARSLRQMNHFLEASERYREVIRAGLPEDASDSDQRSLRDAQAELDDLLPRIPSLAIRLQNAEAGDVEVQMDGDLVDPALVGIKQRVNPGKHTIVGKRGGETIEQSVTLQERASQEITLAFRAGFQAAPKEEPGRTVNVQQGFTPLQTVGIVIMSGGGALLITGIATTIVALGQQSDLRENCPSRACTNEFHGDVDKFNTMKLISAGTLIGGAVVGGIGAVIFATGAPKSREVDPSVALLVRGPSLGLEGTF